ncbi:MAG: hypothetical protein K8S15_07475 [Candidatus Aegiribacteria sp.]|nr:hypothetical protein [Candidatus Aegiribacteria sp.]
MSDLYRKSKSVSCSMCKYLTTVLLSRPIFLEMLFMLNSPGGIVTVYAGIL